MILRILISVYLATFYYNLPIFFSFFKNLLSFFELFNLLG